MKKSILLLTVICAIAYLLFFSPVATIFRRSVKTSDSITVYGNTHLLPLNLVPLWAQEDKERVQKAQQWLYQEIKEEVILVEGVPFGKGRLTSAGIFFDFGITGSAQKEVAKNFASLYDTGLRFVFENKKEVYGCENDSLYHLALDSATANPSFVKSPEFGKLTDLRSEKIAENAKLICAKKHKKVAIIIGQLHLAWFENHNYRVKYPPNE